jgi:hypothetical protein
MFVSSSRYNTDISALRDESKGLLGTLDAFKNTMAYAIYSTDGQCTFASPLILSILDYPKFNRNIVSPCGNARTSA